MALAVGNLGPWPPFSRPASLRFFCPYGSCVHLSMRGTVHGLEGRMEGAGMIFAASGRGGCKILEWFPSGLYGAEITGWCFLELLLLVPQPKIMCGSTPWVLGVTEASRGSWSPSDPAETPTFTPPSLLWWRKPQAPQLKPSTSEHGEWLLLLGQILTDLSVF